MGIHTLKPKKLSQKGQVAMEYLLILAIIFSYISLIILPTTQTSINAATDVSNFTRAKHTANKLASAVDQVGSGAENSKRTLTLTIPRGIDFSLNGDTITYAADYITPNGEISSRGVNICEDGTDGPRCKSTVTTLYEMTGASLITPANGLIVTFTKLDGKVDVEVT